MVKQILVCYVYSLTLNLSLYIWITWASLKESGKNVVWITLVKHLCKYSSYFWWGKIWNLAPLWSEPFDLWSCISTNSQVIRCTQCFVVIVMNVASDFTNTIISNDWISITRKWFMNVTEIQVKHVCSSPGYLSMLPCESSIWLVAECGLSTVSS